MKFIFLALVVLVLGLAASVVLVGSKKNSVTRKRESAVVRYSAKDFPEQGVSLIVPSDPSFGNLLAKLESTSVDDSYSVFLKNTSSRAIVGYSIKWECFDGRGNASDRSVANDRSVTHIVSWIFLHGDEADHRAAVNGSEEIFKPHSFWLISPDSPARPVKSDSGGVPFATTRFDESDRTETLEGCASMIITADGIFFDDGEFIGPDTSALFSEVRIQMDARYEILSGVRNELKSGKKPDEVFKGLERIRDGERGRLGELAGEDEIRSYFRNLFARDVLGRKEFWGADKAIEDVNLQLSKPWVKVRKL